VAFRILSLALLATAFLLVGCGERSEPLGEIAQTYPVTVRGGGERPITLAEQPRRVVALDPGSAELIVALGAGDRLVGVPATVQALDGAAPVVDRGGQVDVDEVVQLRPDLIASTVGVDQLDAALAGRESGAAVYVQPDASLDDVLRGTIELGFLVGEPVSARRVAARIRADAARVEARLGGEPAVSVFVDTGFFITVPGRSLLGDLIERAHGKSVAGPSPGPDPFPVERLRRLDPDVYLATSESRVTLAQLRSERRTADLTAVRRGRFAVLPSDLVLRPGPRVGRALERVARVLHPNAVR